MLRMSFEEITKVLEEKLVKYKCDPEQAKQVAFTMTENALEGVYSHGVNRFPVLIKDIIGGKVRPGKKPVLAAALGSLESYDGNRGLGIVNALFAMDRAIELAKQHGVAFVGLRNTSHWLRGATYGYRACQAGMAAICSSNALPGFPTWGSSEPRCGNNPVVFAFPRPDGDLVCDISMSQFSYGALEVALLDGRNMPVDAGYDQEGKLSRDPEAVLKTKRALPMGYWKGAALSHLLDVFTGVISLGNTTVAISKLDGNVDVSQMFIAVNYRAIAPQEQSDKLLEETVDFIINSPKADPNVKIPNTNNEEIIFTGQLARDKRKENIANGIPVHEEVWNEVLAL